MKFTALPALILVCALALDSCGKTATPTPQPQGGGLTDQASLVGALEAEGATVTLGDPIAQEFFTVDGQIIDVNGQDLQVFEYDSLQAMESDAALVSADGGTIGTSSVMWIDSPHFYKSEKIIVLYVGTDETTLNLLDQVLGRQFAGQ